jgi:hypothetical protein
MIKDIALRTFIRVHYPLKCEHLTANNTLTLHKALISFTVTLACHTWETVADTQLLQLMYLHNIAQLPRHTMICKLEKTSKLLYLYVFKIKLCGQQPEII